MKKNRLVEGQQLKWLLSFEKQHCKDRQSKENSAKACSREIRGTQGGGVTSVMHF